MKTLEDDFFEFKDYCKTHLYDDFNKMLAVVSQTVTVIPQNVSKDEFCETLAYINCFARDWKYSLLMKTIKNSHYIKVEGSTLFFWVTVENHSTEEDLYRFTLRIPIFWALDEMIHRLYPGEYGNCIAIEFNRFQDDEHPIKLKGEELLVDHLVKTQDTIVYDFHIEDCMTVISKNVNLIKQREDKIVNAVQSYCHSSNPSKSVFDALVGIVEKMVSIAATLWGDNNKINPDVADCHDYFQSTTKVDDFNSHHSDTDTIYVMEDNTDMTQTFYYENISSHIYNEDLNVETGGKTLTIYKSGMEVATYFTDIYEGIPESVQKECEKILWDSNFLKLVSNVVNDIVPGHCLDVLYLPDFGVEICSGKRFPVHHTLYRDA